MSDKIVQKREKETTGYNSERFMYMRKKVVYSSKGRLGYPLRKGP